MKEIKLMFKGYLRDENKASLEKESGIYCVYRCKHTEQDTVSLKELLYIGEAENIHDRLANHERCSDWKKHLKAGEELCYSRASISDDDDRYRAEAALIFKHKPPENSEHIDHFGYRDTKISLSGKTTFLVSEFTVKNDD